MIVVLWFFAYCGYAEPQLQLVYEQLNKPWSLTFIDKDNIVFAQKSGQIGVLHLPKLKSMTLAEIADVYTKGQAGLFDVKLAPDFKRSQRIYFTYAKKYNNKAVTALATAKISNDKLIDIEDVLVTDSFSKTNRHFGSRISFDSDSIFFTVGDRGVRENAQDLTVHSGKLLRIGFDGSPLPSNPFVGDKGAKDEIYSLGHRNPQGITFDDQGRLWVIEHGPRGGDELNLIQAGGNYGWPVVSLGKEYWGPVAVGVDEKPGMINPVHDYVPSIAPSDLLFAGGKFYISALNGKHINVIAVDDKGNFVSEKRLFASLKQRVRALAQSPDDWIYFATDSGHLYRFKPEL